MSREQPAPGARPTMKELAIVGGGITGLATAYLAARAGLKVTVLEAEPSAGGLLRTFEVGGNRLECFYHHAFTHDVELRWLLRELGLEDRLKFRKGTMGVYRDGRVFPFNTPRDLLGFRPLGLLDKARFAWSSLYLARWARWQAYEGVPALQWFGRHAGRRATEALWQPLLNIKFGPYAGQIPLAWMVGRMRQRLNSRRRGEEKLGYVEGSLQVVLDALLKALERLDVRVLTRCPVLGLEAKAGELTALITPLGEVRADSYVFTIPTPRVADLVGNVSEGYGAELRRVEYFGAVCTVLELKRSLLPVYWLNIADPGYPFGGIIEHTRLVEPEAYGGRHLVYLSRYFANSDALAGQSPAAVQRLMLEGLSRACPQLKDEDLLEVRSFSSRTAAVVSDLNFSQKVPHCRTPIRRLYLASMPHIYPDERSCNNSIRVAAEACRVLGIPASVPACASLSGTINMS